MAARNLDIDMPSDEPDVDAARKAIDGIRREILDKRTQEISRWLSVLALVFALYAIAVPIGIYIASNVIRGILTDIEKIEAQVKTQLDRLVILEERRQEQIGRGLSDSVESGIKVDQILAGKYVEATTGEFLDIIEQTGQVSAETLKRFIDVSLTYISTVENDPNLISHKDRWDVVINKARIFAFRTNSKKELAIALRGVREVLKAIREQRDIPDVTMLVRGTEKFYDIRGLSGLGSRAWIGFDFR